MKNWPTKRVALLLLLLAAAIAATVAPKPYDTELHHPVPPVTAPGPLEDIAVHGETAFVGQPRYRAHGAAPIMLQAHQDPSPPISFRNIWLRPR